VPKRSTMVWLPLLVLLVFSWGTCPCLYADVLTGGFVGFDAGYEDACACSCTADVQDECAPGDAAVCAGSVPDSGGCPCLDTIGTMHELPQPEAPTDLIPADHCVTSLLELASDAADRGEFYVVEASTADPGPEFRSVVLLV
jgi:hypothetical protein